MIGDRDRLAVDGDRHAAEQLHDQPGGGDDDVGLKLAAAFQRDAVLREAGDPVGDDLDLAAADRLEQIGVGDEADALVPGIVGRTEMAIDVVAGRQIGGGELANRGADLVRLGRARA